jgi:NAD(P)-dependent dehydrogenase (short-subunit alcohol dehydrogenase family)
MRRLDGKVAIITGCGRGFGEAIAKLFAREGAAVSICDIMPLKQLKEKVASKIETAGGEVQCFQVDVSDEAQVNSMVKETIKRFETIDILVNNVGIAGPTKDCWEISLAEWDRTLSVNLGGTFLCTKAVLPEMIRNMRGRIINLSSIAGKIPMPHRTPYATSKIGLIGFTRTLAAEVGRYNITVNAICPGDPGGERNLEVARDKAKYLNKRFDADEYWRQIDEMRQNGVLGARYLSDEGFVETPITHEDVALTALFLASDEACRITGQDINVCGGWVMW